MARTSPADHPRKKPIGFVRDRLLDFAEQAREIGDTKLAKECQDAAQGAFIAMQTHSRAEAVLSRSAVRDGS